MKKLIKNLLLVMSILIGTYGVTASADSIPSCMSEGIAKAPCYFLTTFKLINNTTKILKRANFGKYQMIEQFPKTIAPNTSTGPFTAKLVAGPVHAGKWYGFQYQDEEGNTMCVLGLELDTHGDNTGFTGPAHCVAGSLSSYGFSYKLTIGNR